MKIAFFTDTYLPKFDGVTFVVDSWARVFGRKHEVRVFAPAYARKRVSEKRDGFVVERFQSLPMPSLDRIHLVVPDFMGEITDLVQKFRPDVIHLHSLGILSLLATRIARKLEIPLVGTYHSLLSEMIMNFPPFDVLAEVLEPGNGEDGLIRKAGWGFTKLVYSKCDLIVAPALAIKKDLRKHGFKNWTEVVSNGIDLDSFRYYDRTKFENRLLHVGRISKEKRVDVVLKAFGLAKSKKRDLRLTIVGDGADLMRIKKMAGEMKTEKQINFAGFVPREKLSTFYRKADFFVTASTMEVQPMVILEALSTGLPVIAVNKAGLIGGDVKDGYNGFLVNEPNEERLAEKIILAYESREKWRGMSENARKTAEENSVQRSVEKMEKLYKKLLLG